MFVPSKAFFLVSLLVLVTSCSDGNNTNEEPMLKGIISTYNEYDGAMLDFTKADMEKAGFTLGDLVSITLDDKTFVVPYYDGYYTRSGEFLLHRIAPGTERTGGACLYRQNEGKGWLPRRANSHEYDIFQRPQ